MSWRTGLREASFRGVPFYVDSSEIRVGRKVYIWNPFERDEPFIQDYGKAPVEITIEGHIIANADNSFDHWDNRDDLINAFQSGKNKINILNPKGGGSHSAFAKPGKLIHPYLGEYKVVLKEPATISETYEEGGICRFTAVFIQFQDGSLVPKISNPISTVTMQVNSAINSVMDGFASIFRAGLSFVNSLSGIVKGPLKAISGGLGRVRGFVGATMGTALTTVNAAMNFTDDILNEPCDIANVALAGVNSLNGIVGMAGDIVTGGVVGSCSGNQIGETITLNGESIPEELVISLIESMISISQETKNNNYGLLPSTQEDNEKDITDMNRSIMLIKACDYAIRGDYRSQEQAFDTMDLLIEEFNDLLYDLGSREWDNSRVTEAVEETRRVFIEAFYAKTLDLGNEITIQAPPYGTSSLELAYDKYENLDRCGEIFAMNNPVYEHPGFLTGSINIISE